MGKLEDIYPIAIEHTKQKIIQDIERYFETKETLPTFETYISERASAYLEQIWINVWLNKASNDVPKKEKKAFLKELGYVTEGVDHKYINKIFRNELRGFRPFDVISWVTYTFSDNHQDWEQRYIQARETFFKRQEEERIAKEKWKVRDLLQTSVNHLFDENPLFFYLHVRYHVAKQLAEDINTKPKYKYIDPYLLEEQLVEQGKFDSSDYNLVIDFLEELTGHVHSYFDWGRKQFEYETYYHFYDRFVFEYILEFAPKKVLEYVSDELFENFYTTYGEKLNASVLKNLLSDTWEQVAEACFEELQEEYLDDLVSLATIPFDEDLHQQIFKEDEKDRERKKAEALAEQARKKAEEERMFEDIFGHAYTPSLGKSMKYVLHIGDTNTGKTHKALQKMKAVESGLYLAPLRLLALEVYDKLNNEGIPCSLKTGEEEKTVAGATHISSTVEMFHEKDYYDVIVIDEAQMLADKDRGFSWYRAIMKANAREVHIIGSRNIKSMLLDLLDEADIQLHEYSREIPLEVEKKEFSLKNTKQGDALVCFSRRQVLETASKLQRNGHKVSMIYGSMPPETRQKQIELFNRGITSVVVATDAIGMGLNLPIRRIVFLENEKFDGTRRRRLTSQEVKQIAGRAGRKGIYDVGKVAFMSDIRVMRRLLEQEDEPVQTFAIAPTSSIFERFQKYHRHMGTFFDLWNQFEPPKGTKKASLAEERELYELIRDTKVEARFSLMDLYGFLHLPFSTKEPKLIGQWLDTVEAIANDRELPEPIIKTGNLEEFELSYKAIGLHLLFLYRMDRRTEAVYWERVREEISDGVHEQLRDEVINYQKKCKRCGKKLPEESQFPICDVCYHGRYKRRY